MSDIDSEACCNGKEGFETKDEATKVCQRIKDRGRKKSQKKTRYQKRKLIAYKCPKCPKFHIGGTIGG